MKLYKLTFFALFALTIFSCGKNDHSDDGDEHEKDTIEQTINSGHTVDTPKPVKTDSIKAIKRSVLTNKTYKKKEVKLEIVDTTANATTTVSNPKTKATVKSTSNDLSFIYIKKMLNECKVGQTLTQKQLETDYQIPKDAMKLVKSIKKISDNELDVKWKSTWFIERISDAKLKDGILKVNFKNNKMYTSGGAIGIKYNDKMYTDLVITGRTARIPSVKGFYWQIGKE